MTAALVYEHFVRSAFGYAHKTSVDRSGDPAGLAEADIFDDSYIDDVKVATGYAMRIFTTEIINRVSGLDEAEHNRLDGFVRSVVQAPNVQAISVLIDDFRKTVVEHYFNNSSGTLTLK